MLPGEKSRTVRLIADRPLRRRGAAIVLFAIFLPVALIMVAFAINLAYMELVRTELRISTDAAARAGGRNLAISGDTAVAAAVARDAAARNLVAGQPLQLTDTQLEFGNGMRANATSRYSFVAGGQHPNSLRVTGSRENTSLDGSVTLLMPFILGRQTFEPEQQAVSMQTEVDIALVLDRSGSMAYDASDNSFTSSPPSSAPPGWVYCDPAPPNSRWRDAVAATQVFLNELDNSATEELVSLSTYNNAAVINQELTNNYGAIMSALTPYTNSFCQGSTNVGGGIVRGTRTLTNTTTNRAWASKVLVVMTDGIHNTGLNPVTAAQTAHAAGVMVFSITFSAEANQATMQQVATTGAGKHYHAATGSDLVAVFQEIARSLPTLLTH